MKLDIVRTITEARGPFATVYLEGRNPSEDAATQLRLRWDDLRGRLTESGADDEILAALIEGPVSGNIAALLRFEAPEELGEPELNK